MSVLELFDWIDSPVDQNLRDLSLLKSLREQFDHKPLLIDFTLRYSDGSGFSGWVDSAARDILARRQSDQHLIITDTWEFRENTFQRLVEILLDNGFNPEQLHVVCVTKPDMEFVYSLNTSCKMYHANFFINRTVDVNRSALPVDKQQRLVCLNHRPTYPRAYLCQLLKDLGHGKGLSWSGSGYKVIGQDHLDISLLLDHTVRRDRIRDHDWFYDQHRVESDDQYNRNSHTIDSSIYSAQVNVVSETFVNTAEESFDWSPQIYTSSSVFITEKTLKPILAEQIFLIQGCKNTLSYLHELGIETFGDIIDESYDTEQNWLIRTERIAVEADRLMRLETDEWQKVTAVCKDRLVRNRQRLIEISEENLALWRL